MKTGMFVLVFFSFFSVRGQKTDTLFPYLPLPRVHLVKESSVQYFICTKTSDGKLLSSFLLNRSISKIDLNGKPTWLSVQKYNSKDGEDIDSTFFSATTLAPISYHTHVGSERLREQVVFDGKQIVAHISKKDSVYSQDQSTVVAAYNVVMEEDLLKSLPLRKGYSVIIPFVNPGAHYGKGLFYKHISVQGAEVLTTMFGQIDCWKISYETAYGTVLQWVEKKTQNLIRQEQRMPGGIQVMKVRLLM